MNDLKITEHKMLRIPSDLEKLLLFICSKSEVTIEQLKERNNEAKIVKVRYLYYARAYLNKFNTIESIGNALGKDHSNVIAGIRQVLRYNDLQVDYLQLFGSEYPLKKLNRNEMETK